MGGEGSFGITIPIDELRRVGAIREVEEEGETRKEIDGEQRVWLEVVEPGVWRVKHLGKQSFPGESDESEVLAASH